MYYILIYKFVKSIYLILPKPVKIEQLLEIILKKTFQTQTPFDGYFLCEWLTTVLQNQRFQKRMLFDFVLEGF